MYCRYNDLESAMTAATAAGDDLAGVLVSPFRHDAGFDQELVDPVFARELRQLCDDAVQSSSSTTGDAAFVSVVAGGKSAWNPTYPHIRCKSDRGMAVTALCPGYFPMGMTESYLTDKPTQTEMLSRIPAGSPGELSGIAEVVVLLSPSAAMTGSVVSFDGGANI